MELNRTKRIVAEVALTLAVALAIGQGCPSVNSPAPTPGPSDSDSSNSDSSNSDPTIGLGSIDLNVVKLDVDATTQRGPAVGDGVMAFDIEGGAKLAWLAVGATKPKTVPTPSGITQNHQAFAFGGKKLVVHNGNSGDLYVYDTAADQVAAISASSIDVKGTSGPSLWEVDGHLIATINSWTVTTDGLHKLIKVVNISDLNTITITPFDLDPGNTPDAISLDATDGKVVVRGGDTFYVYDMNKPTAAPAEFTRSASQGGSGLSDIRISNGVVAFFDDDQNFTLLNLSAGTFSQPSRNPGRQNRGFGLESGRFAFFAMQTDDDGSNISTANRALVGTTSDVTTLIDPAGSFVNGEDDSDGRVGFGATVSVSPSGKYVFIAGEKAVGVNDQERLYVSVDGDDFLVADDDSDALVVQRAAGVACSNNLVAFLIPATGGSTEVSIGYATLPPPSP